MGNCYTQKAKQQKDPQIIQATQNTYKVQQQNPLRSASPSYYIPQTTSLSAQLAALEQNSLVFQLIKQEFKIKNIDNIQKLTYDKLENIQDFLFQNGYYQESLLFSKKALARKIRTLGKTSDQLTENHLKMSLNYEKLGSIELAVKHLLIVINIKGQKSEQQEKIASQLQELLFKNKFFVQTDRDSCSTLHSFNKNQSMTKQYQPKLSPGIQIGDITILPKREKICGICQKGHQKRSSLLNPQQLAHTNSGQSDNNNALNNNNNNNNNNNGQIIEPFKQVGNNLKNNYNLFQLQCKHFFHFNCFLLNIKDTLECPSCMASSKRTSQGNQRTSYGNQTHQNSNGVVHN